MFKIEMKAGQLADLIGKMTVRESGGASLFSPLLVNVDTKKKTIDWAWINADHTAFTWGKAEKLKLTGKSGEYVIDSEIIDWINKLFSNEEKIAMEHHGTVVKLSGDKYQAQLNPTDADAARVEAAKQLEVEDNKPTMFKWKEVKLKASELQEVLNPTSLVYNLKEIKIIKLVFDKDGSSATIGSLEAHSTGITRPIDAEVKKGFEITLGHNFAEVMSVVSGAIKVYGVDGDKPIWILHETNNLTVGYLVAQYNEVQEDDEPEDEPKEELEEESPDDDDGEIDLGDDE